jgi:leucyl aminopeptidase (aminopeptidase T)
MWISILALAALAPSLDYAAMAARIAGALKLQPGERVVARYDPMYFAELLKPLRAAVQRATKAPLEAVSAKDALDARRLEGTDVFIRLPLGESARQLTDAEEGALIAWLEKGGARRELHFHWAEGTRHPDGRPAPHPPEFDSLYARALEIDYEALDAAQERAAAMLRRGTVRIHTPAGTDVMLRIGERPFNKQNGDASGARSRSARVRVDRHIELPAGVLRVAPVEGSVAGNIVLKEARFGSVLAKGVRIQVDNGRVTGIRAEEGLDAVKAALQDGEFREIALGFNPDLAAPVRSWLVPYYGYGAGVVRLAFGDNQELGGAVRGGAVRWLFLTDASIHVDYQYMVKDGKLLFQ